MLLALAIAAIQQTTFLSYLIETGFFTREGSADGRALMLGVALFSTFLSIPSFFWNLTMVKEAKEKRDIASIIVSVATFAFGVTFLAFAFVNRVHEVGLTLFNFSIHMGPK